LSNVVKESLAKGHCCEACRVCSEPS
jgi:hypothetical protein